MRNSVTALTISLMIFVGVGVWWIESRFSADAAAMVLGALAGVIIFIIAQLLSMTSQRTTLGNAAEFHRHVAGTAAVNGKAQIELLKGINEDTRNRGRLTVIDERRVDELARAKARALLGDAQSARRQEEQDAWQHNLPAGLPKPTRKVNRDEMDEIADAWEQDAGKDSRRGWMGWLR